MKIHSLLDYNLKNKTALIRVDYNVPLIEKNGQKLVSDPRRIISSYDTIEKLLTNNNKIILLSHLGRPTPSTQRQFSLLPIFNYLQKNKSWQLVFIPDYLNQEKTQKIIKDAPAKTVFLFENLRYHPEEKSNDKKFVKLLASYGDFFVNDAFSTSHRGHASVYGLAQALPSFAGLALLSEVKAFTNLLDKPRRPFIVVVGGAKISDKINPIVNLAKIADAILIGGGVANNFLKAVGIAVQKSYLQDVPADLKKQGLNYVSVADQIILDNLNQRLLKDNYIPLPKIIYPVDVIAAPSFDATKGRVIELTSNEQISNRGNLMYLDIGPKTTKLYKELIIQAETVFWNGPMGIYEKKTFAQGTKEIARAVAKTSGVTVVGGGDTIAALDKFGYYQSIDYVSMAGSAALEFLSGKKLPALAVLEK